MTEAGQGAIPASASPTGRFVKRNWPLSAICCDLSRPLEASGSKRPEKNVQRDVPRHTSGSSCFQDSDEAAN